MSPNYGWKPQGIAGLFKQPAPYGQMPQGDHQWHAPGMSMPQQPMQQQWTGGNQPAMPYDAPEMSQPTPPMQATQPMQGMGWQPQGMRPMQGLRGLFGNRQMGADYMGRSYQN